MIYCLFDFAWGFSEVLASVWVGKEAGLIDACGGLFIPPQFSSARWLRDDLARVELNGKWGFIVKDGTLAVKPMYTQVVGESRVDTLRWYYSSSFLVSLC